MNDRERMKQGMLYNPHKTGLHDNWLRCKRLLQYFNGTPWDPQNSRMEFIEELFWDIGEECYIEPPFFCNHGNISVGNKFYSNTGLTILDEAKVVIGNRVLFGPHVSIYTSGHPIDAAIRATGLEYAQAVHIGDDVWIGGNTVINPGVKIGNGTIIGSGSVVTKDIPDNVVAAGNPCRILRTITPHDIDYWHEEFYKYINDIDGK